MHFAPSTYYAAKSRPPSELSLRHEELEPKIKEIYQDNRSLYGVRKVWKQAKREGINVGRDQVASLMTAQGLVGVVRGKKKRTTIPDETAPRPTDLVKRDFTAQAPNRLWVADLTYVSTWSGFCYVAFIIDAFSRFIVGWKMSMSLSADVALDALEMAIWVRKGDLSGLVHHSDRGVQYLSIRYTERLAEAGVANSVGSKGDSYDNALAESVNGLYKTEVIRQRGPMRTATQVELETGSWVAWYNQTRLHSYCGDIPPAEFEDIWHVLQANMEIVA